MRYGNDALEIRRRIVGSRPRGWAWIAAGAVLLVLSGLGMKISTGRSSAADACGILGAIAGILSILAFWGGIAELRRRVLSDGRGRSRNSRIEDAELRWHPDYSEIPGAFDSTLQLVERSRGKVGTLRTAIVAAAVGSARARLVFDGAPYRIGSEARMRFKVQTAGIGVDEPGAEFVLRCIRETPGGLFRVCSKLEILDESEPYEIGYDAQSGVFRIAFTLPPELPASDLLAAEPVYWELTVSFWDPIRLRGQFFVPVSP
jgi:hypothetical protein